MAESVIVPVIHEASWDAVVVKIAAVAPYVPVIHIDITDGTLTGDKTLADVRKYATLIDSYPDVRFEAHLMVLNPEKYIRQLVDAGFSRLIAHVECNDPRRFLDEARFDEVEVGLAMDGTTEVTEIEPFLEEVDLVLVMTKEMDAGGGSFLPEAVERIRLIRQSFADLPIEVAGGITEEYAKTVREAGATRIAAGSFIFKTPGYEAENLETLSEAI